MCPYGIARTVTRKPLFGRSNTRLPLESTGTEPSFPWIVAVTPSSRHSRGPNELCTTSIRPPEPSGVHWSATGTKPEEADRAQQQASATGAIDRRRKRVIMCSLTSSVKLRARRRHFMVTMTRPRVGCATLAMPWPAARRRARQLQRVVSTMAIHARVPLPLRASSCFGVRRGALSCTRFRGQRVNDWPWFVRTSPG